jgi:site-specific recombinase XerD
MNQLTLSTLNQATLDRIERELERDPRLQSDHSRRAYRYDLIEFEAWRQNRHLSKLLVEEYAAHLHRLGHAPRTINRSLAAIRWWARRISELAFETDLDRAQRDEITTQAARIASVHDVAGDRTVTGRHIGPDEFQALLQACQQDNTSAGRRDAAIIALAWGTGLRRSEIVGLHLRDYHRTHPIRLDVRGKGNKTRAAFVHSGVEAWLQPWLRLRGQEPGPLFCPVRKGGKIAARRGLSDEALAQMLSKRSKQAGLAMRLTWHDFRRTFAGNLLDAGVDLVTVQKLLGHSSPTTTSNYDRRGAAAQQRAIAHISIGYMPPRST